MSATYSPSVMALQRLQVHERGVAHVHARGLGRAVRAHEAGELAARGLDRVVRLARRDAEALGHQLEVVDQRLHRRRQLVPRRQRVLAVAGDVVALGQPVERLVDDLQRLAHLGHADAVAVVVVADGPDRDLEVEVVVARVGRGLAQVPRVAGGAQQRAGDAELQQRLLVHDVGAAQTREQELVVVDQVRVLVQARREAGRELLDLLDPAGRDVLGDAADLEVARVHALAGRHLEQVQDRVAVAPAVEEHGHRAEVQAAGGEPQQVRRDPVELHVRDAQVLGARRDVDAEQRLDRAAVGHRVEVVREVVHPLDERDDLPVRLVFAVLLDARVDVADDRLDVLDDLALERRDQPQHAVGGGVVRTEVEGQQLVVLGVLEVRGVVGGLLQLAVAEARGRGRLAGALRDVAHFFHQPGLFGSLCVKRIASPPIGKSRRCGWPS